MQLEPFHIQHYNYTVWKAEQIKLSIWPLNTREEINIIQQFFLKQPFFLYIVFIQIVLI